MEFMSEFMKEWGTFSLALYGAGMSTIMLAREHRRNSPLLKIEIHGALLCVRNVGPAPVYLSHIGYVDHDWALRPVHYQETAPRSDGTPQGRLDRWQEVKFLTDLRKDIPNPMAPPRAWWAREQSGILFTSFGTLDPRRFVIWLNEWL